MRTVRGLIAALLMSLAVAGCSRAETPKPTVVPVILRFAADDTALPLLQRLAEAYAAVDDHVTIRVIPAQPIAFQHMLVAGQIELVATSRLIEPPAGAAAFWVGDLALDGVAVIVNAQNPVSGLTLQDVRDIFSGVRGDLSGSGDCLRRSE